MMSNGLQPFCVMLVLLGFAIAHMAIQLHCVLWAEKYIGPCLYRVLFCLFSQFAFGCRVISAYFFLITGMIFAIVVSPGRSRIRYLATVSNSLLFFVLYPATFNLLEIAAIQKTSSPPLKLGNYSDHSAIRRWWTTIWVWRLNIFDWLILLCHLNVSAASFIWASKRRIAVCRHCVRRRKYKARTSDHSF